MAQLVERTLGKGEVPSSILGISTILFGHREVVFLFVSSSPSQLTSFAAELLCTKSACASSQGSSVVVG